MREVRGDARGVDNIIEGQLIDQWARFQKKRERLLTNSCQFSFFHIRV